MLLFRVIPIFCAYFGNLATLLVLWWSVTAQERKMDRYRLSIVSHNLRRSTNLTDSVVAERDRWNLFISMIQDFSSKILLKIEEFQQASIEESENDEDTESKSTIERNHIRKCSRGLLENNSDKMIDACQ